MKPEVTEISPIPTVPTIPISSTLPAPRIVTLVPGKETATVDGRKTEDGSVVVDTNKLPKNEWTVIKERPSNCQFGFEMDEYGACFGKF